MHTPFAEESEEEKAMAVTGTYGNIEAPDIGVIVGYFVVVMVFGILVSVYDVIGFVFSSVV